MTHTPNISTLYVGRKLSIEGILAKSRAGILSTFHIAKDELFFLVLSAPGLISIVPDSKKRICNTKRRKRTFYRDCFSDMRSKNGYCIEYN